MASSLLDSYEHQFAGLTAEITTKIGKIPNLSGGEKRSMISSVEKSLDEAHELLEQMDLEIREIPSKDRQRFSNRLKSYQSELTKLEKDFKRSRIAYSDLQHTREELLGGDDVTTSEDQRARLLDNTEKLDRTNRRLEHGYRIAVETEQVGADILENLQDDRRKIERARERLRETDTDLGKSSRVLSGMMRRFLPSSGN
ncbi:vesicle transport through interaction with t-SNAREs homolog 1A-like isoform X2 [Ptychodera flava]|uniref:vesicle transport through interaction with t-SNAREs homolog 1A-like isoform X2 n=1 Tax=Ptychodera flava TaxID=63121 RepID=UPI00396A7FB9